jgi:hypothetical protein
MVDLNRASSWRHTSFDVLNTTIFFGVVTFLVWLNSPISFLFWRSKRTGKLSLSLKVKALQQTAGRNIFLHSDGDPGAFPLRKWHFLVELLFL